MPIRLQKALLVAFSAQALLRDAHAKTVMGIADGSDYQLVTKFCFVFPAFDQIPMGNGRIHSQTIVSAGGHRFLVVNVSDLNKGISCDQLVQRAKVMEPLNEKTKDVIAYDLTLNVERSMNGEQIAAVIARCGQRINAEYIIEFTNPNGGAGQHFACGEQSLLQTYALFSVIAFILGPLIFQAHRVLHRRQAHNEISALFFTGAGFFIARIILFSVHILVYSHNGIGLGMLAFVAQFLDLLSSTMAMLVLVALAHGVCVTRPCVPPDSAERTVLIRIVGVFACSFLLITLIYGFRTDISLNPFGAFSGSLAWVHLLSRAWVGVFCLSRGTKLAATSEAMHKKTVILRFSFIAFAWLCGVPVIALFSSLDTWGNGALVVELTNFVLFGVILHDFWPSRFGTVFSCTKPTERMHPYSEFGFRD